MNIKFRIFKVGDFYIAMHPFVKRLTNDNIVGVECLGNFKVKKVDDVYVSDRLAVNPFYAGYSNEVRNALHEWIHNHQLKLMLEDKI